MTNEQAWQKAYAAGYNDGRLDALNEAAHRVDEQFICSFEYEIDIAEMLRGMAARVGAESVDAPHPE